VTAVDLPGLVSLGLVALEWLGLGWLSGVDWPAPTPWAPRWCLRLLIGATLIGFALLLLAVAGVPFAWPPLPLLVAAIAAGAIRWLSRHRRTEHPASYSACGMTGESHIRRGRLGWMLLSGVLMAGLIRAIILPETGWDAYSHWGLKAQAFFYAGAIVDAHSAHEYYPPLVPLLETWLYFQRGVVSIDLAKTLWAVFGASFGVCLVQHLRLALDASARWPAPVLALVIILATPQLLEGFWTGQADLALTVYLTLMVLAMLRWYSEHQTGWLVQAMFLGAGVALTKYEGLFRVGVVLIAFVAELLIRRRPANIGGAVSVGLASSLAYVTWALFRNLHGIQVTSEHLSHFQPEAIGSVLLALAAVFGGVRTGGGLVVSGLACVAAGKRLLQPPLRFLTFVVVGQLAATLLGFLVTADSPALQVQLSATRLFEQFMPIALFASALWLCESAFRCVQKSESSRDPHTSMRRAASVRLQ